jgi:hypothetical protein
LFYTHCSRCSWIKNVFVDVPDVLIWLLNDNVCFGRYIRLSTDDSDDALCTQLPEGHLLEAAFTKDDSVPLLGEAPVCGNRKRARTEDDHGSVPVSPALKSPKIAKATQSPVLTRYIGTRYHKDRFLSQFKPNIALFYHLLAPAEIYGNTQEARNCWKACACSM